MRRCHQHPMGTKGAAKTSVSEAKSLVSDAQGFGFLICKL